MLDFALCCCHLEILNTFGVKGSAFSFCIIFYITWLVLGPKVEHHLRNHFSLWYALGSEANLALSLRVVQSLVLMGPPTPAASEVL